ncbi:MAG: type II toxin-antitoxin system VapC family toxin [Hyphomicrobiales bacterium]|nr:type II toxin-antitoxin system VapC family toxin [Hyphomicrobiales bacterium]
MLAVDTNVVVRYVVGDGGDQFERSVRILENNEVSIGLTVVLETEWVLRDAYEYSRQDILAALQKILGLPTVTLKDQQIVRRAMDLASSGLDFADALHVAQAGECEAFVTLDKPLVRKAKGLTGTPVRSG